MGIGTDPVLQCQLLKQTLAERGCVDAWWTTNHSSYEERVACKACPTSHGTVRDYMYISHHLVSGTEACNIDADAMFREHLPVQLRLRAPRKRDVVNYLKAPIQIDHVLDKACSDGMALVHNCIGAQLAENNGARNDCKHAYDVQGMWRIWSESVERGMLLVTGCPVGHTRFEGKGKVRITSKLEG